MSLKWYDVLDKRMVSTGKLTQEELHELKELVETVKCDSNPFIRVQGEILDMSLSRIAEGVATLEDLRHRRHAIECVARHLGSDTRFRHLAHKIDKLNSILETMGPWPPEDRDD